MADLFKDVRNKFKRNWPGAVGVIEQKRVTLTSAEIKALFTTPKTLIPAPGAGFTHVVQEVVASLDYGTVAYTGANALEIRYTGAAGVKVSGDIAAACLNSASDRMDRAVPVAVAVAVANAPIVACVPTANPAAGDGTLILDIIYRTVKAV